MYMRLWVKSHEHFDSCNFMKLSPSIFFAIYQSYSSTFHSTIGSPLEFRTHRTVHKSLLGSHADTSRGTRGLKFYSSHSLLPYFPWHLGNESTQQCTLHYCASLLDFSTHCTVYKSVLGSHAGTSSGARSLKFCSRSLCLLPSFKRHLDNEPDTMAQPSF